MIKKILLASSVLSLAVASNAAEKEFYVIKDGKMSNCEFVPSSDTIAYVIEESVNDAGEAMVKFTNPDPQNAGDKGMWKSGLLYLKEGIDLSEAWNLEIEYYFDKGTELTGGCADHEGWQFDLMADTLPVSNAKWKSSNGQIDYRISHVSIDARMRDFYSYKDGQSVLDNHGVGVLRTVRKYVYSTPLLPAGVAERGDGNVVKAMFVSIFNEAGKELSGYIKNLKFVSEGTKPFYADNFRNLDGEGTIYQATFNNYIIGTNAGDETIGGLSDTDIPVGDPTKMYGQALFVSQSTDGYYNQVFSDRMYCKLGEQSEAGFFDTEYGYVPYLKIYPEKCKTGYRLDEEGVIADAQLRIPLGTGAVDKVISIAMRLGHNAGDSGDKTPYADYKEKSKDNERFPVMYRFESGDAQTIASKTEWKQFRPTFTKDSTDYVDSIPTMMQMVYGDVELPSKEYSYITLRFIPNDVISFMFTDVRLTGDTGWWPRRIGDYSFGKDYKGNTVPTAFKNDVENIVAKGEISIYPNPATDVITVTNEGVKSVAVYSIAGSLVASSESNVVNVANLVNGIYVVKANTEAGVVTGQIIKK
ncbi:MAG: T9SS type A sorting domain-containing protein [Paludibacteraceae bacterium]|nr:T9SS type A sorting domain-containing protein [Paludibacteraceae bacterium]